VTLFQIMFCAALVAVAVVIIILALVGNI